MASQDPRSDKPQQQPADTDALAVDALPDEVRLHGNADETEETQPTTAGPEHEPADSEDESQDRG
jgi:hypothetical protein